MEAPASVLYVSTVSFWEPAIKQGLGKIDGAIRFDARVERHGIRELTAHLSMTEALRELPMLHGDSFDRMLVAQAMTERMVLVTADRRLAGIRWRFAGVTMGSQLMMG